MQHSQLSDGRDRFDRRTFCKAAQSREGPAIGYGEGLFHVCLTDEVKHSQVCGFCHSLSVSGGAKVAFNK